MRHMSARWPVISFLELFCCALGGAGILLVLINRDIRGSITLTQMLRVKAIVQMPGSGEPILTLSRENDYEKVVLSKTAPKSTDELLWGECETHDANTSSSTFFACDAGGRQGLYRVRLTQERVGGAETDQGEVDPDLLAKLANATSSATKHSSADDRYVKVSLLNEALIRSLESPDTTLPIDFPEHLNEFQDGMGPSPDATASDCRIAIRKFTEKRGFSKAGYSRQLALMHVLLLMHDGSALTLDDLVPFCKVDRGKSELLWSDIRVFLALTLDEHVLSKVNLRHADGKQVDFRLGTADSDHFGRFSLFGDATHDIPIRNPVDVREALDAVGSVHWRNLDPMWCKVAERLCRPRDLRVVVEWGGLTFPQQPPLGPGFMTIRGGNLRPHQDEYGRTFYELEIELQAESVEVRPVE